MKKNTDFGSKRKDVVAKNNNFGSNLSDKPIPEEPKNINAGVQTKNIAQLQDNLVPDNDKKKNQDKDHGKDTEIDIRLLGKIIREEKSPQMPLVNEDEEKDTDLGTSESTTIIPET